MPTQQPPIGKLMQAAVTLTSSQPFEQVLQQLVDIARDIVDARYAALGIIDAATNRLAEFVTSGITPEERARLPHQPVGEGLLGMLIREPRALRVDDIAQHPASVGTPAQHPAMKTLLAVPIVARARMFGNLYVTEKRAGDVFTDHDLELLQMLAALAATAVENAQLRQERERFFAAASHELGNAVAGVRLWAEHLAATSKDAPPDWLQGLRQVKKGADNAHRLIDDLLSLARIQEGRLKLVPWPTDVSALLLDVAEQFRPELEKSALRIDAGCVAEGVIAQADTARLRQIFVNLLSNALKFAPAHSVIAIGVQRDEQHVRAWVADQGPGVAPADVERIFKPYEQVSGVARGRGAGLGLPLSRQLARMMGGELWVESEVGPGARFILQL